MSTTYLVTGGAGFIGSAAVRRLLSCHEARVAVADILSYCANPLSLQELETDPRFSFFKADVADEATLRDIFREVQPDRVLHLAAESHVDRSIDDPRAFLHANVGGTFSLLEATRAYWEALPAERRERFRLLHVSTDEVYGDLPKDAPPAAEGAAYRPSSPYSATKAAADHLVRAWARTFGLPCLVTSCTNNYGPRQFPEKLVPLCILRALEGRPLPIYGDGLQVRDWLHVDDHARALALVLKQGRPGESWHIAGNSPCTNIELVLRLCRVLDRLAPTRRPQGLARFEELIVHVPDRPGHDVRYALDASKIRRDLGWAPAISLERGLEATVRWYLDNEAWWRPVLDGTYRLERLGRARQEGMHLNDHGGSVS
ncbi:MAG: dTDP-glucose 4,6-dehydratase [Desulfovibrio sp.]|nr:dTDP-glucose 4,6-dehydratase [Desulfovibrio sp.]